jgi:hypothetical protein
MVYECEENKPEPEKKPAGKRDTDPRHVVRRKTEI